MKFIESFSAISKKVEVQIKEIIETEYFVEIHIDNGSSTHETTALLSNVSPGEHKITNTPWGCIIKVSKVNLPSLITPEEMLQFFRDDKKEPECKWKTCKDGSIHVEYESGGLEVYTINSDGGITHIAYVDKDGKRRDYAKERPITLKRIK